MAGTMFYSELFGLLTLEQEILERVVDLASQQQQALIQFESTRIEEIAREQEVYAKQMDECELQRIRLISATFGLSLNAARSLKLSQLATMIDTEHVPELLEFKDAMNSLTQKVQFVNNVNRVLAVRGRNSVKATLDHVRSHRLHVVNASL